MARLAQTVPEYLERMRRILAAPEALGIRSDWLALQSARKEQVYDRTAAGQPGVTNLTTDDAWMAGLLGGIYTAITCLREPQFHHSTTLPEECECGMEHPLVDAPRLVGNLLATMQALLRQHDFYQALAALPETQEAPPEPEVEE